MCVCVRVWERVVPSVIVFVGNRCVADGAGPAYTFKGHATEGYAMDWSRVTAGRLLTGDCSGGMRLWDVDAGREVGAKPSWDVSKTSYSGHTDSVEDVQWSPNEANVRARAFWYRVGSGVLSNLVHHAD